MPDKHERDGWVKVRRGAFHRNLLRLRTNRGLTQIQLAEAIGVTQSRISEWERDKGEPNLAQLHRLADALRVKMGTLLEAEK